MTALPRTPSFRLDGRRALVAGASSGIGLGCAVALAEAGAHVTLAARRADKLAETVDAFTAEGWAAEALAFDVADTEGVRAALAERDPFDIMINSAGLAIHSPATETDPGDYDRVTDLNTRGAVPAHFLVAP